MTSYTTMKSDRFHSSESLGGSGEPGRCRNCANVGATSSGFAKPSAWSFSGSFAAASGSFGSIRRSTRSGELDRGAWCRALSGEGICQHGPLLSLHLDRADLAEGELAAGHPECGLGDVDLAGRRGLLEPGGRVDGVPHDPVLARAGPH